MPSSPLDPAGRAGKGLLPLLLLPLLLLAGCAGRPWETALPPEDYLQVAKTVEAMRLRDAACPETIAADLTLFYRSPLESQAVSGYLQFSLPQSYRFVVSNPLGQPLLLLAGNDQTFQAINTISQKYLAGGLPSFARRHDIPEHFFTGDWGSWLTARSRRSGEDLSALRADRTGRGVWVQFKQTEGATGGVEHVLVDLSEELILSRILEDHRGRSLAQVDYGDRLGEKECRQPLEITISGLDYGVELRLQLSEITLSREVRRFTLPVPPGYQQQFQP